MSTNRGAGYDGAPTPVRLRAPFKACVVRDCASLARLVEDRHIENVCRIQLMNSTEVEQRYRAHVQGLPEASLTAQAEVQVAASVALLVVVLRHPDDLVIAPLAARAQTAAMLGRNHAATVSK